MENKTTLDNDLLKNLCDQYDLSYEKMIELLDTEKVYQLKDRRTGVYDALKKVIKSNSKPVYDEI